MSAAVVETSDDEERQEGQAMLLAQGSQSCTTLTSKPSRSQPSSSPSHARHLSRDSNNIGSSTETLPLSSQQVPFEETTMADTFTSSSPVRSQVSHVSPMCAKSTESNEGSVSSSIDDKPRDVVRGVGSVEATQRSPLVASARSAPATTPAGIKRRRLDMEVERSRSSPSAAIRLRAASETLKELSDDEMDLLASQRGKVEYFNRLWVKGHVQGPRLLSFGVAEATKPFDAFELSETKSTPAPAHSQQSALQKTQEPPAMEQPKQGGSSRAPAFKPVSSPPSSATSSILSEPPSPSQSASCIARKTPQETETLPPLEDMPSLLSSPARSPEHLDPPDQEISAARSVGFEEIPPELLAPSPPRQLQRRLRERKAAQLNPFTHEQLVYQKTMLSRNWEGAIISRKEALREERRRVREENKDVPSSNAPGADWLVEDPEQEARRERRRKEMERRELQQRSAVREKTGTKPNISNVPALGSSWTANAQDDPALQPLLASLHLDISETSDDNAGARATTAGHGNRLTRPQNKKKSTRRARASCPNSDNRSERPSAESLASIQIPERRPRKRARESAFDLQSANRALSDATSSAEEEPEARSARKGGRRSATDRGNGRHRRSAQSTSESDPDEEEDLVRRFKVLKKMMPKAMAKKYIQDLQAMRKGKQYHSDGHYSSTPDPSDIEAAPRRAVRIVHSEVEERDSNDENVVPGVARRRRVHCHVEEASQSRFDIVGDPESEQRDTADSATERSFSSDSDDDEGVVWLGARQLDKRQHSEDLIDRMLSRAQASASAYVSRTSRLPSSRKTNGRKVSRASNCGSRKTKESTKMAAKGKNRTNAPHSRPLQPVSVNIFDHDSDSHSHNDTDSGNSAHRRVSSRGRHESSKKKSSRHVNDRPRFHQFRGPRHAGFNPPIVNPRQRRLLDHEMDAQLFGEASVTREQDETSRTELPNAVFVVLDDSNKDDEPEATHTARMEISRQDERPEQRTTFAQRQQRAREIAKAASVSRPLQSATILQLPAADPEAVTKANLWAAIGEIRTELGIPAISQNIRLGEHSFVTRGELQSLLEEVDGGDTAISRQQRSVVSSSHFGLGFNADTTVEQVLTQLPTFFDSIRSRCERISTCERSDAIVLVDQVLEALGCLSAFLRHHARSTSAPAACESVAARLEHLSHRIPQEAPAKSQTLRLRLQLSWLHLQVMALWRKVARTDDDHFGEAPDIALAAKTLIYWLLKHGLHNTMRSLKDSVANEKDSEVEPISDESIELWLALMHLLGSSFWAVFEETFLAWLDKLPSDQPHVRGEMIWFGIFTLSAISQISPKDGTALTAPFLQEHWPLVGTAITSSCLRYDASVESTMSDLALEQRDIYIHTVLRRIMHLTSTLHWRLWSKDHKDGESLLRRVCKTIFDAKGYYFQSLPSETGYDFPLFLRAFDESLLEQEDEGRRDSSFHMFLKLLIRFGKEAQGTGAESENHIRETSRFFHRLLPVQRTKFAADQAPTKLELSRLYNLYSMATVTLYMAPDPGEARWQMRRVQGWLDFAQADHSAQLVCIRAVQYLGVVCQHHRLGLEDVVTWFEEVVRRLKVSLTLATGGTSGDLMADRLRHRRKANTSLLLKAALRALRNVILHASLAPDAPPDKQPFPDKLLLSPVWTDELLTSPIVNDATIALEAVACLQAFLSRRLRLLEQLETRVQIETGEDTQDSWDCLWKEADFNDTALGAVLDAAEAAAAVPPHVASPSAGARTLAEFQQKDRELARTTPERLTNMLFWVVSNLLHSEQSGPTGSRISLGIDATMAGRMLRNVSLEALDGLSKLDERRTLLERLLDSWAGWAHVLVHNGVQMWEAFISTNKPSSIQRLPAGLDARDASLRFMLNMVDLDPAVLRTHTHEIVKMWYRSVGARLISVQAPFTRALAEVEPPLPFFDGVLAALTVACGSNDASESTESGYARQTEAVQAPSAPMQQSQIPQTQPQAQTLAATASISRVKFLNMRAAVLRVTLRNMRQEGLVSSTGKRLMLEGLPHLLSSLCEEVDAQQQHQPQSEAGKDYLNFVQQIADKFVDDVGCEIYESRWFGFVKSLLGTLQTKLARAHGGV
ncbi:hypothetical protein K437DRAFT_293990 [Tilletiaria anomala UBC 951]|uniref:Uncharacterized protein n=1 Tax=Tilletiaria anomala (strain ATCC 24038 / CBS 436.72 / UBC 951) TaxID=1037660 RepID=A0A066WB22_TILAU|nr:uncharacterized protein K437DRAFT_293990 [Tilletiaria anomala UBC 951]KDN47970.1 hypothetical protein K437DRAFT_293990 [Tilletiaria anomala UBC 951]